MADHEALKWSSSPAPIVLAGAAFGGFFVFGLLASHTPVGQLCCAASLAGLLYVCFYLWVYEVTLDSRGEVKFRSLAGTRRTQLAEIDDIRLRSDLGRHYVVVRYGAGGLAHFAANDVTRGLLHEIRRRRPEKRPRGQRLR